MAEQQSDPSAVPGGRQAQDLLADLRELESDCEKNRPEEYGDGSWSAWAADIARQAITALSSSLAPGIPVEQAAREALGLFAPGSHDGLWGRIKAFIVNGAPTRDEGIAIARQITEWQCRVDDALIASASAQGAASVPLEHDERERLHAIIADCNSLIDPERDPELSARIDAVLMPCDHAGHCVSPPAPQWRPIESAAFPDPPPSDAPEKGSQL